MRDGMVDEDLGDGIGLRDGDLAERGGGGGEEGFVHELSSPRRPGAGRPRGPCAPT
ncbi:Uncharacterised protein [Mycobacteroides abscessus subsp. abscessus]|nr:Uncharacterised protein [Mycobacteroides abscessus subsp. abscessus]